MKFIARKDCEINLGAESAPFFVKVGEVVQLALGSLPYIDGRVDLKNPVSDQDIGTTLFYCDGSEKLIYKDPLLFLALGEESLIGTDRFVIPDHRDTQQIEIETLKAQIVELENTVVELRQKLHEEVMRNIPYINPLTTPIVNPNPMTPFWSEKDLPKFTCGTTKEFPQNTEGELSEILNRWKTILEKGDCGGGFDGGCD